MPVIWNDSVWHIVDEDSIYNKNEFVVLRKLFIKPVATSEDTKQRNPVPFNETTIRYSFRKYGAIESVEILKSVNSEAYATFECDINAFAAYMDREKRFVVEPAHTWKQPLMDFDDNLIEMDENYQPPIFMIDDCLLELFKYFDFETLAILSGVCQKFNCLIHEHFFSKIKKFKNIQEGRTLHLGEVRKTLRCIEPLLLHLTTLTIYDDNGTDINFEELCPNLTELKLSYCMSFPLCTKQWPKLTHLMAFEEDDLPRSPELVRYLAFFTFNPQLICLKISAHFPNDLLPAMVTHLINLEKLVLWPTHFPEVKDLSAEYIDHLSGMRQLTKLTLNYLESSEINGILQSLVKLTQLKELKLYALEDEDTFEPSALAIIEIAQKLSHLEKLCFQHLQFTTSIVLDIIRYASHLKFLRFQYCDVDVTTFLTRQIVDILKERPQHDSTPMELYVDFTSSVSSNANNEIVQKYLQVKRNKY